MQDNANNVTRDEALRADVCIVGGGAAGITIARELAGTKHSVILLESGTFEFDQATQDLYSGTVSGLPYAALDETRVRFFGGSTNHWAGESRPLETFDFQKREWVPESGWPFDRSELEPYFPRAHKMCGLGPYRYDSFWWTTRRPQIKTLMDTSTVRTAIFQGGPGSSLGETHRDEVVQPRNIRLLLEANVVNVRLDGRRVAGVDVKTLAGNSFTVDAPVVVLAMGGIENVRMLLASRTQRPAGLGNDRDLVGRYFMDHPLLFAGQVMLSDRAPDPALSFYAGINYSEYGLQDPATGRKRFVIGMIALTPRALRKARLPGWRAQLFPTSPSKPDAAVLDTDIRSFIGDIEGRTGTTREPKEIFFPNGRRAVSEPDRFDLRVGMEPTPSRDSRVTLTGEVDALGVPRVDLRWAFNDVDYDSVERGVEIFGQELGRMGLGRVQRTDARAATLAWGHHHMGTTRMHRDPSRGVVDQHSQVHGIRGLYVAGSSVFPTAGYVNPTLNIIAMSMRLADRLKKVLS